MEQFEQNLSEDINHSTKKPISIWWLWAPVLFVIIALPLYYYIVYINIGGYHANQDRGTFGDTFGAVNALFSGLAFAVLIYTMTMQRKELELQREELSLTRKELSRSAQAQEKSEEALKKQAKAYILSAIINGENSFVIQFNNQLNYLEESMKEDFHGGMNYNEQKTTLITLLSIHQNTIQNTLTKLNELRNKTS